MSNFRTGAQNTSTGSVGSDECSAKHGSVTMIAGPMFAGKTTRLIRFARDARLAGHDVYVFKSVLDTRYDDTALVTHDGLKLPARPIADFATVCETVPPMGCTHDTTNRICVVDEVQFLEASLEGLVSSIQALQSSGCDIVCAGLDLDHAGRPFATSAFLLAMADYVEKVSATCAVCGKPTSKTALRAGEGSGARIRVGGIETYEPRCNASWSKARTANAWDTFDKDVAFSGSRHSSATSDNYD